MKASASRRNDFAIRMKMAAIFVAVSGAISGAFTCVPATAQDAPVSAKRAQASERQSSRAAFDQTFAARLNALAEEAAAKKLPDLSTRLRDWYVPRYPDRQYVFLPPSSVATEEASSTSAVEQALRKKWMEIRDEQADHLADLADRELVAGNAELAVQLLYEVLRERPDDKKARRALGIGKSKSRRGANTPRVSRNADQAYGWPAGGYWRMQTDHFLITTNHSAEAAVQLGVILEEFHAVWRQLFVSYWTTPAAVRQAISGRGLIDRPSAKHKVVLFKNQQEYVDHLKRSEPQASITLGIYRDKQRAAFFFAGDEKLHSTWRHEVAHQLFYESLRRGKRVGAEQNFWLVEGIALYLESLRRIETCGTTANGEPCDSAYYTVGGFDAERLQFARYRALNESFYVPSEKLVGLGRTQLQQDPRIRRLYTQSAGLTHFLLDGENGRYRAATLELLRDLYNGSDDANSLSKLTAATPAELDSAYRRYLIVKNNELSALSDRPQLSKLCLGNATVTDSGLEQLSSLTALTWLDLAHCDVSDVGIRYLSPKLPITQLNLEGTKITDAALAHIGQWDSLTELDLSQTEVGDAGLVEIAKLKNLRVLWLTGTQVTDAGIRQLTGLKDLETLDVSHTGVTREAWDRLQNDLPKLNTAAQN